MSKPGIKKKKIYLCMNLEDKIKSEEVKLHWIDAFIDSISKYIFISRYLLNRMTLKTQDKVREKKLGNREIMDSYW